MTVAFPDRGHSPDLWHDGRLPAYALASRNLLQHVYALFLRRDLIVVEGSILASIDEPCLVLCDYGPIRSCKTLSPLLPKHRLIAVAHSMNLG